MKVFQRLIDISYSEDEDNANPDCSATGEEPRSNVDREKFTSHWRKHCTFFKTEVSQIKPSKYTSTFGNVRLSSHT